MGEDDWLEAAYEQRTELYDEEAEFNAAYCDLCGFAHSGPCPDEYDDLGD
jgi:hypothetical protein